MKHFVALLALLASLSCVGFGNFREVDPSLKPIVATLIRLPEASYLLSQITREGPVAVRYEAYGRHASSALWSPSDRSIVINASHQKSPGQKVASLLFEMHNAATCEEFFRLDRLAANKRLSKEEYIESIERLEHANALKTSDLLEKAIAKKIYPPDCRWPIYRNFEEHFRLQRKTGHSSAIASAYRTLTYR